MFADDDRIQVVAAHLGAGDARMRQSESLAEYAEANGYTYAMVEDGREIGAAFEIPGIPYFLVVGPDGDIVAKHLGRLTDEVRDQLAASARGARPSS